MASRPRLTTLPTTTFVAQPSTVTTPSSITATGQRYVGQRQLTVQEVAKRSQESVSIGGITFPVPSGFTVMTNSDNYAYTIRTQYTGDSVTVYNIEGTLVPDDLDRQVVCAVYADNCGTSMCATSITCPIDATCYTGTMNNYVGCCSYGHTCVDRTTCLSYVSGQATCDNEAQGCVFCSDPFNGNCFTLDMNHTNDAALQRFMWCTDRTDDLWIVSSVENEVTFGSMAPAPASSFSPHLTSVETSSSTYSSAQPSNSTSTSPDTGGSYPIGGIGGIVGIGIGSAVCLALLIAFIAMILRSYRRRQARLAGEAQQQPRGTLGGAILPGTWMNNKPEITERGLTAPYNAEDVGGSQLSRLIDSGSELADTATRPYTRELDSTHRPLSRTALGLRHGFTPYSPDDILLPAPPYANNQASHSDPGINGTQEASTIIYLDGVDRGSGSMHSKQTQFPTAQRHSYASPPPILNSLLSGHSPRLSQASSLPSPLVSPVATDPSPRTNSFHQPSPSLDRDTPSILRVPSPYSRLAETPTSDDQQPSTHTSKPLPSLLPTPSNNAAAAAAAAAITSTTTATSSHTDPTKAATTPLFNPRSSSLHGSAVHISSSSPSSPTSPPSSPTSGEVAQAETQHPTRSSSLVTAPSSQRQSLNQRQSNEQGVSARGTWRGWVSPEVALAEGLWEEEEDDGDAEMEIEGEREEGKHGAGEK